jgi:hypothetical protein
MCETIGQARGFIPSHHCKGERLISRATGYDMGQAIREADAPTLRDALNHDPGKTQRKLIESRLRRLERNGGKK